MSIMTTLTFVTAHSITRVRRELVSRQLPIPIMADSAGSSGCNSSIGLKNIHAVVIRVNTKTSKRERVRCAAPKGHQRKRDNKLGAPQDAKRTVSV